VQDGVVDTGVVSLQERALEVAQARLERVGAQTIGVARAEDAHAAQLALLVEKLRDAQVADRAHGEVRNARQRRLVVEAPGEDLPRIHEELLVPICAHSRADVAQDDGHELATGCAGAVGDRRLGGKLLPILAKPSDGAPLGHATRLLGIGHEAVHVGAVRGARTLGQEHVEGLPEDLLRGPAEDGLGALVVHADALRLIEGENGVDGDRDDAREARLRVAQGARDL
jgi:hypothetical protein